MLGPVFVVITLYFGLPGNPVSTVVNCRFYVHYALGVMQQKPLETPIKLRLDRDIEKPEGMVQFASGEIRVRDEPRNLTQGVRQVGLEKPEGRGEEFAGRVDVDAVLLMDERGLGEGDARSASDSGLWRLEHRL